MGPKALDSNLFIAISKALNECIDVHGPINKHFIGSAAKRIMVELMIDEIVQKMMPSDVELMLNQMGAERSKLRTKWEKKLIKKNKKLTAKLAILHRVVKKLLV